MTCGLASCYQLKACHAALMVSCGQTTENQAPTPEFTQLIVWLEHKELIPHVSILICIFLLLYEKGFFLYYIDILNRSHQILFVETLTNIL